MPGQVSSFIKREGNHSLPSKARLIQAYPNLATQAEFGPEFTSMQKTWCEIFDGSRLNNGIRITIASGMNASQLGDWMRDALQEFPAGVFYERDGKSWDATMQEEHHNLKIRAFSVGGPQFVKFLKDSYSVKGTAKNIRNGDRITYKLTGTVKSGHNDTSSGNSLVNACITYESMVRLGLGGWIIVMGDDCLVRTNRPIVTKPMEKQEGALGIIPEARCFSRWQDVSFLSGIWVDTGDASHPFGFIPKPGRILARCFWTTQKLSRNQELSWRRDVSECLLTGLQGVPIVTEWLETSGSSTNVRKGEDLIVGDRNYTSFEFVNRIVNCHKWFQDRYGLTTSEILSATTMIRDLGPMDIGLIVHPTLDRIMEVDLCDIDVREEGFCFE
jgi:hypothetical protein